MVERNSRFYAWDGVHWNRTPACTLHHSGEGVESTHFLLLINLDQGGTWPHVEEGKLCIFGIDIEIDSELGFQGILQIGFVSDQNPVQGRVNVIRTYHVSRGRTHLVSNENFFPYPIICDKDHWAGEWWGNTGVGEGDILPTTIPGISQIVEEGDLVAYWSIDSEDKDADYSITIRYIGLNEDDLGYLEVS